MPEPPAIKIDPVTGPKTGDVLDVESSVLLFLDEEGYQGYAELMLAGANTKYYFDRNLVNTDIRRLMELTKGSKVRVLKPVAGGAKVVIERLMQTDYRTEDPDGNGQIGWLYLGNKQ